MPNKTLFSSMIGKFIPQTNAVNEAGGTAYQLSPKAALAQYAATGCLSTTFYASAENQLQTVLNLCSHPEVDPEFIARVALYSRSKGHMKVLNIGGFNDHVFELIAEFAIGKLNTNQWVGVIEATRL